MHKTLQRYVINDFAKTFLLAMVVLTLIFFLGTSLRVVRRFKDIDLDFLMQIVPAMVAGTLLLTLPTSVLAATTLTFSRLSHDNEITAVKACGIHLGTIIRPVVFGGAILSVVTFVVGAFLVPRSQLKARQLASQAIDQVLTSAISDEPATIGFFKNYRLHYAGTDGDKVFRDLVLHRIDPHQGLSEEIMARRGRLIFGRRSVSMELTDGSIAFFRSRPREPGAQRERLKGRLSKRSGDRNKNWAEYEVAHFRRQTNWVGFDHYSMVVELDIDDTIRMRPRYRTVPELGQEIEKIEGEILPLLRAGRDGGLRRVAVCEEIIKALATRDAALAERLRTEADELEKDLPAMRDRLARLKDEDDQRQARGKIKSAEQQVVFNRQMASAVVKGDKSVTSQLQATIDKTKPDVNWHEQQIKRQNKERRKLATEYHRRFSFPLACLVVVLLGAPLGILVRHANKLVAFGVSAVPVFGLYYPLLMVFEGLAEKGKMPPLIAMQMPNLVVGALGLYLLRRVFRQ